MGESTAAPECSFENLLRCPRLFRDAETLGEPPMGRHDSDLSRIRVVRVVDPRRDIPRHRRFVAGIGGGEPRPDGTRAPLTRYVEDRWGDELDIPCASSPECGHIRDTLNRPDIALEAIGADPAIVALVRGLAVGA
jgi:hypothetical protein